MGKAQTQKAERINISKCNALSMFLCGESIMGSDIASLLYSNIALLLFVCINYGREYCIIIVFILYFFMYCLQCTYYCLSHRRFSMSFRIRIGYGLFDVFISFCFYHGRVYKSDEKVHVPGKMSI